MPKAEKKMSVFHIQESQRRRLENGAVKIFNWQNLSGELMLLLEDIPIPGLISQSW